ncbi:MAG: hypothetical protein AAF170_04025 [Bacteroidota bacterium]
MAEVAPWERRFVELYVDRTAQDRALSLLKGRKHRTKWLNQLNHSPAFNFSKARDLGPTDAQGLLSLLASLYVHPTGYLIADASTLDGKELRIELAVEELLRTRWGAVLICPPKPIAIYREESPGAFYLFTP